MESFQILKRVSHFTQLLLPPMRQYGHAPFEAPVIQRAELVSVEHYLQPLWLNLATRCRFVLRVLGRVLGRQASENP
jgi:hypothetical protein